MLRMHLCRLSALPVFLSQDGDAGDRLWFCLILRLQKKATSISKTRPLVIDTVG